MEIVLNHENHGFPKPVRSNWKPNMVWKRVSKIDVKIQHKKCNVPKQVFLILQKSGWCFFGCHSSCLLAWGGKTKTFQNKNKTKVPKMILKSSGKMWYTLYKKILTQKNHHEPTWHIFDTCLVTYSSKIQLKNKGGVQENLHWIAWPYEVFKFQCG